MAGHVVQQARYSWEVQRRRVLNSVRIGYFDVLLAQRMIDTRLPVECKRPLFANWRIINAQVHHECEPCQAPGQCQ